MPAPAVSRRPRLAAPPARRTLAALLLGISPAVGALGAGGCANVNAAHANAAHANAAHAPAAGPAPAAFAAPAYDVGARELTADEQVRHALARLTFGARPGDAERVRAVGVDRWIDQQLDPARIPDPAAEAFVARFPSIGRSGAELLAAYPPPGQLLARRAVQARMQAMAAGDATQTAVAPGAALGSMTAADSAELRRRGRESYRFVGELQAARVGRAVASERQLQEVMTDFWLNHFNVFAGKDRVRYFLPEYDALVRGHALGRFRDLLGAVAHSPAMLYYLDNWQSTADSAEPTLAARRAPRAGGRRRALAAGGFGDGAAAAAALALIPDGVRSADALPPAARARLAALPEARRAFVVSYMALDPAGRERVRRTLGKAPRPRRQGLNENYGRELLELHTLGADGGYTQQDVVAVARALTGWTVRAAEQGGGFAFRPEVHDAGAKVVLGQRFPAGRGEDEGERVLDLVARHPSTARHIARKLAVRFVSDSPPPALVDRAAETFRRTDGDVRATLAVILHGPEFFSRAAYRAKVKTPFELVASAARALGAPPDTTARTAQLVARLGQPVFGHQAPDGWPEQGDAWMNTGAILNRINFGTAVAAGRVPGARLTAWPAYAALRAAPREAQIDGVVAALLGGEASPDTRAVLARGENPLAAAAAARDTAAADADEPPMAGSPAMTPAAADRRAARRRAREDAGQAPSPAMAAREAVKPGRAVPAFGGAPLRLDPFAQLVGLALGAPEFQRR